MLKCFNISNIYNISNISNVFNISNIPNIPNISNISNVSNISNISNIFIKPKARRALPPHRRAEVKVTHRYLTVPEMETASKLILLLTQQAVFSEEFQRLENGECVTKRSKLHTLNPFIDDDGLIRVGGRLEKAKSISFDERHPIVLSPFHHITRLIIESTHLDNLHTGTFKLPAVNYLMGNLPAQRVTLAKPFEHTGVDYCGSLFIKEKKFRNRSKVKVWIAIFVCFTTKAVHIEVVDDLSTDEFLAAFSRFISRHPSCNSMYSDNGTNFVGAKNELKELYALVEAEEHKERVQRHLNTLCIKIEGILNSQPLTPLSSDPNDLTALTPAHFLHGSSTRDLPAPEFLHTPSNRLSYWEHIEKLKQEFWSRWQNEYLNELQIRHKWNDGNHQIEEGSLVLLRDDNAPPSQ
ncbi:uncharacterized protein LOC107044788 [Diachasma alloeum]|uniref:uncharacterized protein LOC107044788 n=1 Tax=Diachasma alloeum TaxID=454923 RepID=UPI00073822A4|nr:uncharacterized protein LOC107044788 [Diachasma alloeum]